jgi:hypothetical protein
LTRQQLLLLIQDVARQLGSVGSYRADVRGQAMQDTVRDARGRLLGALDQGRRPTQFRVGPRPWWCRISWERVIVVTVISAAVCLVAVLGLAGPGVAP